MDELSTTFKSITPVEPVPVPFNNEPLVKVTLPSGVTVETITITDNG